MKNLGTIFIMICQIFLIIVGITQASDGKIGFGVFNIIINTMGITINAINLLDKRSQ